MNRGVVGVVRRTTDGQAMLVYAQKCKKKFPPPLKKTENPNTYFPSVCCCFLVSFSTHFRTIFQRVVILQSRE